MRTRNRRATIFASDSFNRANGSVGAMDGLYGGAAGKSWTVNSGTWAIASNKLSATVGGNLVVDLGVTVCRIRLTHDAAPGASANSIIGHFVDANNHWRVAISNTALLIFEVTGGSPTTRATTAIAPVAGDIWEAWFLPGMILADYPKGNKRLSYASALYGSSTVYGIRTPVNGTTFENFVARSCGGR